MLPTAVTLSCLFSAAVAGILPNNRQESTTASCFAELGSISIKNVPTSTSTVTNTDEVVFQSTTIPVTTVTPDAITLVSTDFTTVVETVTATTVTDTFSTTSTDFITSTTTELFTATQTSNTDISTTTTVTNAILPSSTFYDTFDTLDGYPSSGSKVKRYKCKAKGQSSSSGAVLPSASSRSIAG
ncbi:putative Apple domain-containing protein [Seiridium cardinale]|uniref:Apple domain-containing protein n=1 Tax=Seiridium cardinale TaxID=138064 RepID=A0ABR2XE97_9PEZI